MTAWAPIREVLSAALDKLVAKSAAQNRHHAVTPHEQKKTPAGGLVEGKVISKLDWGSPEIGML